MYWKTLPQCCLARRIEHSNIQECNTVMELTGLSVTQSSEAFITTVTLIITIAFIRIFIFPNATPSTVPSSTWLISDFFKHFTCLAFTVHACSSIRNNRKLSQQNVMPCVTTHLLASKTIDLVDPQILLLLWSVTIPSSSPLLLGQAILQYFYRFVLFISAYWCHYFM